MRRSDDDQTRRGAHTARALVWAGFGLLVAAGCASIAGLDGDFGVGSTSSGAGTAGGQSTTSTSTGSGGEAASGAGGDGGTNAGGAAGAAGGTGGGTGGSGGDPLAEVAAALDGKRLELPCTGPGPVPEGCAAGSTTTQKTVGGVAGVTYLVTVRVRGVVEQNSYLGGTADGYFYVGGAEDNPGWNVYRLDVSAPAQHYFFNAGSSGILHCFAVDYQRVISIEGGADLTLLADAMDGVQVRNIDSGGTPIVVPNIPPDPQPFDGQFLQFDVVHVAEAP